MGLVWLGVHLLYLVVCLLQKKTKKKSLNLIFLGFVEGSNFHFVNHQKDNGRSALIKKLIKQIVFRIDKYIEKHVRQTVWTTYFLSPSPNI